MATKLDVRPPIESADVWSIFTDGGCIRVNPSPHGGTWAFCYVGLDGLLFGTGGITTPAELGFATVENNVMETLAILLALEGIAEGWRGDVFGDNLNSLRRARNPESASFGGVPDGLRQRLIVARRKRPDVQFHLIGGHATAAELAAGQRADGRPVSKYNGWCHGKCQEAAAEFFADQAT